MARYLCKNAAPHVPILLDVKIMQHPQETVCGFTLCVFPFFLYMLFQRNLLCVRWYATVCEIAS